MKLFKKLTKPFVALWHAFLNLPVLLKIIVILLFVGIIYFAYTKLTSQPKTTAYITAPVEKGTLVTTISSTGTITSASTIPITTQASGVVTDVSVQNGDSVTKGQKIAEITLDAGSQQQQQAALANYLNAQNSLNTAKAKMNALQANLFEANQTFVNGAGTSNPTTDDPKYIIQKANWQQAEADYNNQAGIIKQAEAALASTWLSYIQTSSTITAAVSGKIRNINLTKGQQITTNTSSNSTSQTFGSISIEGNSQANINLSEIDVLKVRLNQHVSITLDALPDKTFTGRVSAINTSGSVSSGVTTYPATITFDTDVDNAYANMTVNAKIITSVKNDVLLVPVAAVQTSNGESTVRIMKNGTATPVTVEVGESNDTQSEIISGVKEGDKIITGGGQITGAGRTQGQQTTSPFGNTGARGFGVSSGGNATFIRR